MNVFFTTLSQTAYLLLFIALGFLLVRGKWIPDGSERVISRLENLVFVPALVLGTFMKSFTPETLSRAGGLLLGSFGLGVAAILLALFCTRLLSKDPYEKGIYAYGLCFSNFGYMGNAVVSALFPHLFMGYLIFTLPLWALIYLWGAPVLLLQDPERRGGLRERLKSFLNPMFACTLLGMLIGLTKLPLPSFLSTAVDAAGACMSPLGMLLTGMTVARYKMKEILGIGRVYVVSLLRLIVFPGLFLLLLPFLPTDEVFATCAVASLAMPLGLNTVILPASLGRDTRIGAGQALVSHVASCLTVPLILTLYQMLL
ncbi:MAG: AEC family transporter [Clostridia bacterium]|nr:AEC family transporter [Clostridia bacterium]